MGRKAYESFVCSCGERVVMVPHEKGRKLAPITEAAYDRGNILIVPGDDQESSPAYRIVPEGSRGAHVGILRLNHWATCAHADRFRK